MRRGIRAVGTLLAAAGLLTLIWVVLVWQWQDPFTSLYTRWQQHKLASQYDKRAAAFHPQDLSAASLVAERQAIAAAARRYRRESRRGDPLGRIRIPRMGVNLVFVNGTDHHTLKKGPGRDLRTFMPGENRLVYIAGHRTTYGAPFSHIEELHKNDKVALELPYATFVYRVTGYRIVRADDFSVLRSPRHELLEIQACHPRFFASHRYVAYAQLIHVDPRGGTPFDLEAARAQSSSR
jgi:sortase A